jgi:hypothetical protein
MEGTASSFSPQRRGRLAPARASPIQGRRNHSYRYRSAAVHILVVCGTLEVHART